MFLVKREVYMEYFIEDYYPAWYYEPVSGKPCKQAVRLEVPVDDWEWYIDASWEDIQKLVAEYDEVIVKKVGEEYGLVIVSDKGVVNVLDVPGPPRWDDDEEWVVEEPDF